MSFDSLKRDIGMVEREQELLRQQALLLDKHRRTQRDHRSMAFLTAISLLLLGGILLWKGLNPEPVMGSPIIHQEKIIVFNETHTTAVVQQGLKNCVSIEGNGIITYRCEVK